MSYIDDHFEELVLEFEDPESRTRRRLRSVYAAMLDALWRVEQAGNTFFDQQESVLIDLLGDTWATVELSWRNDLAGVQNRALHIYDLELVPIGVDVDDLDNWCSDEIGQCENPDAIASKSWQGLVAGRKITNPDGFGAGPVPDAAMPSYLAEQIGILQESIDEQFWWSKLLNAVPEFVEAAGEKISEATESAPREREMTNVSMGTIGRDPGSLVACPT